MKRSANLEMLFTEVPFEERFQKAKDAGFDAVEFAGWLQKDMKQVKQATEAADIKIAAFTGDEPYSPIDPAQQDDYIAHVARSAELAAELGCGLLVTHSNALGEDGQILCAYPDLSYDKKLLTMYDITGGLSRFSNGRASVFWLRRSAGPSIRAFSWIM